MAKPHVTVTRDGVEYDLDASTATAGGHTYDLKTPTGIQAAMAAGVSPLAPSREKHPVAPAASARPAQNAGGKASAPKTSVHFRGAAELTADNATVDEIREEHTAVTARVNYLARATEGRSPLASEKAEYDKLLQILDSIESMPVMKQVDRRGVVAPVEDRALGYRPGAPLAVDQTFVGAMRALNGLDDGPDDDEGLSLQGYLRGALLGSWDASNQREREVFASLSGSSSELGGILIPSILAAEIIDQARAQTRVLQAGARLVPMANRKVTIPKWVTDPVPEWRKEGEAFAEDDAGLSSMELSAKGLGVVTKATIELLEDTNIQGELEASFAKSFAQVIDLAALYSEDDLDEEDAPLGRKPTGIKHTPGVNVEAIAANGAAPTWDALVNAVGRLRDVNEDPTGQIMSDRTLRTLSMLKETGTGAYVQPPSYLDGVTRYVTSQVPNDLDTGTSTGNTSDLFTADWSKLLIGVRSELRIMVLKERYLPDSGEIGFVAFWRGDFGVTRPAAFDVLTGIKAA